MHTVTFARIRDGEIGQPPMRNNRTQHIAHQRALGRNIIDIASRTCQKTVVFDPRHRLRFAKLFQSFSLGQTRKSLTRLSALSRGGQPARTSGHRSR